MSWEPLHGYTIMHWIRRQTGGRLEADDAALYQSLHRLEGRQLLRAEWGLSDNNRRAKFYELTARGRRELARQAAEWRGDADAVSAVLGAERSR